MKIFTKYKYTIFRKDVCDSFRSCSEFLRIGEPARRLRFRCLCLLGVPDESLTPRVPPRSSRRRRRCFSWNYAPSIDCTIPKCCSSVCCCISMASVLFLKWQKIKSYWQRIKKLFVIFQNYCSKSNVQYETNHFFASMMHSSIIKSWIKTDKNWKY